MSEERFGGVLMVAVSDPALPYVRMHGNQMWYPCEKSVELNLKNNLGFQSNYTSGHDGEQSHKWVLKSTEIYQPREGSEYDSIYLMIYTPVNKAFIEAWLEQRQLEQA